MIARFARTKSQFTIDHVRRWARLSAAVFEKKDTRERRKSSNYEEKQVTDIRAVQ